MAPERSYAFACHGCGETPEGPGDPSPLACRHCGEPLSILSVAVPSPGLFDAPPASMWHYAELLPVRSDADAVTLGEGATPLVEAPRLAARLGLGELLLKSEMCNPTGSFKDRQVSVGITRARELGAGTVAVVSSGNVACAAAAYAARAGMQAVLLMHGHAAGSKVALASAYGARPIRVASPSAGDVFKLCIESCNTLGWYHLSTAGMYEPFNVEGAKTVAYELYRQTGGDLPDWIVAPVGGGGLLGGIWRGLLDLERLGLIARLPRLAGIQAAGCAPFVRAIETGQSFLETLEHPWPEPRTIAGGIADDILFDGHTALPAVRTTDGAAIAVDDTAILDAEMTLASMEGVLCEPSSAVTVAALPRLPGVTERTRVCCVITGSGAKDLDAIRDRGAEPVTIEPSLPALMEAVGENP